jgi:excisionase family DNA binding protein
MLTAAQVRQRLGISRATLEQLIRNGEIEAIRISKTPGSAYRISEQALADYIERQTVKPAAS